MPAIRIIPIKAKLFDLGKVRGELLHALVDEGKVMKARFEATTATWSGDTPRMVADVKMEARRAEVWAGPTGDAEAVEKWRRLDEGTDEHPITPRNAPYLRFPFQGRGQSYTRKTQRRWLGSRDGGQKLGPIRCFQAVTHPGNDPNEWSEQLLDEEEGPFTQAVQRAVDRALR